jgi:hypothetical protein
MNDEDREDMNRELLRASGKTMEQLNEDFDTGIKNGYSIEQQMEIIRRILG